MAKKKVNLYYMSNRGSQIERIRRALQLLGLDGMNTSFQQLAEEAVRKSTPPLDFLERLVEKQVVLNEDTRITRWTAQAKFPWQKTLQDFDFSFQPSIDKTLILELASARFVEKGGNIVFLGPPGVGKTHLSIALGIEAIQKGSDVRFLLLDDLINQILKISTDLIRLQRLLTSLLRVELLVLDDIDYYRTNDDTSEFLFKLVMQRYKNQTSTIFTSNKSFDQWKDLFGQPQRTSAAIDRITQRAEIITIDGKSFRLKDRQRR